jgi:hypothetical protein
MTLKTTIAGHVSTVFLDTTHFAVTVQRYVGGVKGSVENVSALVTWDPTQTAYERDRATRRASSMMLASSQAVTTSDSFKIGNDLVQVEAVGPIQDGAVIVTLKQYIPQTKGGAPVRTGEL